MIAGLGEAGTGDEAHVAGAEDSYAHLEDIFGGEIWPQRLGNAPEGSS